MKRRKTPQRAALRGKRLNYNASLQIWYRRAIKKLIVKMADESESHISKLFNRIHFEPFGTTDESLGSQARILMNSLAEKFDHLFSLESQTLASFMLEKTLKSSETNIKNSLRELSGGLSLKAGTMSPELTDVVNASIAENVSLIKSIPQQYFKDITGAVMRSVTSGQGMFDLLPQIRKYRNLTERRAELLALDQTRKAYSSINAIKLVKRGITHFEWLHSSGGQTPRESHVMMSGKVFSFENLIAEQQKLGVPKEDQGMPSYPINCRCTFGPVIELDEE